MRLLIDEYTGLESPLHRWDPRYKLVGLVTLVFAFSFVRDLRMLLAMAAVTITVYAVSRLPATFVAKRFRYPSFFLVAILLTLPFLSGESVIATWGPVAVHQEGLLAAILIATRFTCILIIGMVLLGTTPLLTNIKAMRSLGLPDIMADMALLSFRYLQEIGRDLRNMQTAMRLRGFRARRLSRRGLKVLAWLGGSLLVYSYERSESIYRAMILRGYGHAPPPKHEFQASSRDTLILVAVILVTVGFIIGDIALGHNTAALLQ
ncbi:MAG: cobalt ECF transporter T component CbiQ [Dehalococcoidales bacterium]|nr:cobalt ECF transporter T component CbiQ [Dehalococcoidales bacterium]